MRNKCMGLYGNLFKIGPKKVVVCKQAIGFIVFP